MEVDRKELSLIKEVLKENPRGLTVTEISKQVRMNRHSVAKYLEMLTVSGHLDMKSFGPSKVYYLSQRLPISAMLSFSSDFIIILDKDLRIANVNEKFLEFTGLKREDIIHKNIQTFSFPLEFEPSIIPSIQEALEGKESIVEAVYQKKKTTIYFFIKFIPTVFDDADKGVTVIFEDVTERKRSEEAIRESEQKFRSVIEQSLDGIVLTDEQGMVIEFNRRCEEITGVRHEDALGKYLWESNFHFYSENEKYIEIWKNLKRYFTFFMKNGIPPITDKVIELDVKRPDGKDRVIQITYFIIRMEKERMFCVILRDVTEKKLIERAIFASEAKFRSVIEQTVNGIIIVDENGRITEFNRSEERITGYKREEMIGQYIWDFQMLVALPEKKTPESAKKAKEYALTLIKNGEAPFAYKFENRDFVNKNGEIRSVRVIVFPIKSGDHYILCSINYDITEQKKIEREIKESEEKFRSIIEQSSDGIILTDEQGKIIEFNKGMEALTGFDRDRMFGELFWNNPLFKEMIFRTDGSKMDHVEKIGQEFLRTGDCKITGKGVESDILQPDGTKKTVQIVIFPIKTEKGYKLAGIARDVTERKRIEDELKESEEKFRKLAESTVSGIVILQDGALVYANPATAKLMGRAEEDMRHITMRDFMAAEIVQAHDPGKIYLNSNHVPKNYEHGELKILAKDGEQRWIEYNMSELRYRDKPAIIITFFDITARKLAEDALQKAHDELEKRVKERTFELEKANSSLMTEVEQRKKSEEALKESEKKYRSLIENIVDIVWETNAEAEFVYVSPQVKEVMGYSQEELLGKSLYSVIAEEERDRVHKIAASSLRGTGEIQPFEVKCLHKDGHTIYLESSVTPIMDQSGRIRGFNGITRDITERKAVEERLQWNEAFLRTMANSSPFAYYAVNTKEDNVIYYNNNFISLWGLEKIESRIRNGEMKATDVVKYALEKLMDSNDVGKSIDQLKHTSHDWMVDDEMCLNDGRIIRRYSTPIKGNNDQSGERLYMFEDITERKRAENALWESQRFLTTLIGNLPGMIYRCENDEHWTMDYVSEGCYKLTEYNPQDLLNNNKVAYEDLIHPEDREYVRRTTDNALKENKNFKLEYRITTASGVQKWVLEQGCESESLDTGKKMIEGYITDITERKLAEERMSVLASFPELNPSPVIELNMIGRITYMNPAAMSTFPGLAPGHPVIGGLKPLIRNFENSGLRSTTREIEFDGTVYSQFIYYVPEKNIIRIYASDITERKRAEEELHLVNRSLRVINDCNQALVRAADEQTLLKDICRIIVEKGGYRLSWVGYAQHDEKKSVKPVAFMGFDESYVHGIKAAWGDDERSSGPTGMAIKTGKPSIVRYSATDPKFAPWREEALKRGYASTIALPLRSNGTVIGNLNIYSTKVDAFDSTELKLLMELADDLSYGIMTLRSREERKKAEESLQLMKHTIDSYEDSVYWVAPDATIEYANQSACKLLGYSLDELMQMSLADIDPQFSMNSWGAYWNKLKAEKSLKITTTQRTKNGAIIPVEITSNYINFNGKEYNFGFARRIPDAANSLTNEN